LDLFFPSFFFFFGGVQFADFFMASSKVLFIASFSSYLVDRFFCLALHTKINPYSPNL